MQHDSGVYEVRARNKAGTSTGKGYLRVIYWWQNGTSYNQHAAHENPKLPLKVAITLAINRYNGTSSINTNTNNNLRISTVDSTHYAMKILRKLNNKATDESRQQGNSREGFERIIQDMVKMIGHPLQNLDDDYYDMIMNMTECGELATKYNCLDYRILRYRTINGTCNNLFFPLNGAANMPFARMLPAEYEDNISMPNGMTQAIVQKKPFQGPWPSPRYISWNLIKDKDHSSDKLSHMFMSWGQFLDHDLTMSPVFDDENGEELECDCNHTTKCLPIMVKQDDPVFGDRTPHKGECLPLTRSVPACHCPAHNDLARNQINQITSFIDASNVYGSDDVHASNLRLNVGGLLKVSGVTSGKSNLPFQDKKAPIHNIQVPLFDAGDSRANEQVALIIMHTIWNREHNRIAGELSALNPCWGDEKIYQEARKIVGAMMQVITYKEFLPMLFGQYYEEYVPPYFNYNPFIDATILNEFAAAAFRFGHSLVRPFLLRFDEHWREVPEGHLPLEKAFFNPIEYFKSNGTDPILRGLLASQSRDIDEFLNSILTTKLFTRAPGSTGMDLASLNIQRGRDHGLAPYRKWQKLCENLYPHRNATFHYHNTISKMRQVYGDKTYHDGMDLWVGGLSEQKLPGAQVGPTFACIIGLTFTRVRDGDRFWYENPYIFKSSQLRELRKVKLSKVICNNSDDITEIQPNAFRSDQSRVSCNTLSGINLSWWRDHQCYKKK
jgi:peroxidase